MDKLIDDVVARTGLERTAAAAAVRSAIEVLASGLAGSARDDLLAVLPAAAGEPVPLGRGPATTAELYRRTGQALGLRRAEALETAEVVCQAIQRRLSGEARARIAGQLDPQLVRLLVDPVTAGAARPEAGRRAAPAAGGRPGSRHPISESRPGSEQPISESRPGSEHPVSRSGPGSEHPVSRSRPGSEHPISESRPGSEHSISESRPGRRPVAKPEG